MIIPIIYRYSIIYQAQYYLYVEMYNFHDRNESAACEKKEEKTISSGLRGRRVFFYARGWRVSKERKRENMFVCVCVCVYGTPSQGFTLEGPRVAPSTLIS